VSVDRQTIGTRKEAIPGACGCETVVDTLSIRSGLEIVVGRHRDTDNDGTFAFTNTGDATNDLVCLVIA
jgi:hypothetical protein